MDHNGKEVCSRLNDNITFTAIPGHFATSHSHINYYVDLTEVKLRRSKSKLAGMELAKSFLNLPVDTIICLEGTELTASYLADELAEQPASASQGKDLFVIAPELSAGNEMVFRDNNRHMVEQKNILLLVASTTTGRTILRSQECLQRSGGVLVGIGALFSAVDEVDGSPVASVFGGEDLPDYRSYVPGQCDMCIQNEKIDAIANSFGYIRI